MKDNNNIFNLINGKTTLFNYTKDEVDLFYESVPLTSQKHMFESVSKFIDTGYVDLSERMNYLIDTIQTLDSDNLKIKTLSNKLTNKISRFHLEVRLFENNAHIPGLSMRIIQFLS